LIANAAQHADELNSDAIKHHTTLQANTAKNRYDNSTDALKHLASMAHQKEMASMQQEKQSKNANPGAEESET
jgi:hypothetical protein